MEHIWARCKTHIDELFSNVIKDGSSSNFVANYVVMFEPHKIPNEDCHEHLDYHTFSKFLRWLRDILLNYYTKTDVDALIKQKGEEIQAAIESTLEDIVREMENYVCVSALYTEKLVVGKEMRLRVLARKDGEWTDDVALAMTGVELVSKTYIGNGIDYVFTIKSTDINVEFSTTSTLSGETYKATIGEEAEVDNELTWEDKSKEYVLFAGQSVSTCSGAGVLTVS